MTNKEFEIFAKKWPKIAEILLDTSKIPEDFDEERDTWLDVAMNILNTLWKAKKSNIFHRPVDPIKLAIPDYFTVVKNPMDLSTVKVNEYSSMGFNFLAQASIERVLWSRRMD